MRALENVMAFFVFSRWRMYSILKCGTENFQCFHVNFWSIWNFLIKLFFVNIFEGMNLYEKNSSVFLQKNEFFNEYLKFYL